MHREISLVSAQKCFSLYDTGLVYLGKRSMIWHLDYTNPLSELRLSGGLDSSSVDLIDDDVGAVQLLHDLSED